MDSEIETLRGDLREFMADIRGDIRELRSDLVGEDKSLRQHLELTLPMVKDNSKDIASLTAVANGLQTAISSERSKIHDVQGRLDKVEGWLVWASRSVIGAVILAIMAVILQGK